MSSNFRFISFMILACSMTGLVSCAKDVFEELEYSDIPLVEYVIGSDMEDVHDISPMINNPRTKTAVDDKDGISLYWLPEDKLGVITKDSKTGQFQNSRFDNDKSQKAKSTTFSGNIAAKNTGELWAYYPYQELVLSKESAVPDVPMVIPTEQWPSLNGFDGKADFLYAEAKITDNQNPFGRKAVNKIVFDRKVGIMKVIPVDKTKKLEYLDKAVESVRIEVLNQGAKLAGEGAYVVANHGVGAQYKVTETATNRSESNVAGGSYVCVNPQTLVEGTKVRFMFRFADGTRYYKTIAAGKNGIVIVKGGVTSIRLSLTDGGNEYSSHPEVNPSDAEAWKRYANGDKKNVLLDFSYAGYHRGEEAPMEGVPAGYKVYNVTDYGAVANDGKSDRDAFIKCLEAAGHCKAKVTAPSLKNDGVSRVAIQAQGGSFKAVIRFPEGEFILHTAELSTSKDYLGGNDDYEFNEERRSRAIEIYGGDLIIQGAGRGKTKIKMAGENYPHSDAMYSSPNMLLIKCNSGIVSYTNPVKVSADAPLGSFSVKVNVVGQIKAGDWVCLSMSNTAPTKALLNYETGNNVVYMGSDGGYMSAIRNEVKVFDYHKVRSVEGGVVTFYEPLLRNIDLNRDGNSWEIKKYNHYANVGVEDLTFVGDCVKDFVHHRSWKDDGAYKPISYTRLVDSWIRRVGFESVSECASLSSCANCSAYDIEISGKRGHAGVRSEGSSRVFLGKIWEYSSGKAVLSNGVSGQLGDYFADAGQYHASGVSKPSMGAVLWRNHWGKDAIFESHASQPRATLVDCCKGGWVEMRFGGDKSQVPNHLGKLTIWNMYVERVASNASGSPWMSNFQWWKPEAWAAKNPVQWRITPPIVVGFTGENVTFDLGTKEHPQMEYYESINIEKSLGKLVTPESLYEAQLKMRLGYVPTWLEALKTVPIGGQ